MYTESIDRLYQCRKLRTWTKIHIGESGSCDTGDQLTQQPDQRTERKKDDMFIVIVHYPETVDLAGGHRKR